MKRNKIIYVSLLSLLFLQPVYSQRMDETWQGQSNVNNESQRRGQLFRDGKYAMFIHWGIYSELGNKWDGKTYYGIGEWLMHPAMANIPPDRYMQVAGRFNPVNFDAKAVAKLAKDAGMKYIVVTSKHHDGFSMFHSKVNRFNVVDASPFKRDPMIELANACREFGLGFGFYYSQNQDWTYPGGDGGPKTDAAGNTKSFDDYFWEKCYPEVNQITTEYGPIEIVWFDTPGGMDKKYAEILVELVHKNQPGAFVSGRVGHGLGDYTTLGDMEVPVQNIDGLWETVDVTNDSWGFAWYDQNWKSSKEILTRALSTIARGGTYMLNVGPKPDGTIPEPPSLALTNAGLWIKKYPQVVYGANASPWKHALPWGDATVSGNKINLLVYEWPSNGHLHVPGIQNKVNAIRLLGTDVKQLDFEFTGNWLIIDIPGRAPEQPVSVIELTVEGDIGIHDMQGLDPETSTVIPVDFAKASKINKEKISWMEKFGEWKHILQARDWTDSSELVFEIDVLSPGYYHVDLKYAGAGRLVWKLESSEGKIVQNQQNASHIYNWFPWGWIKFESPGKHWLKLTFVEGDSEKASMAAIKLTKAD